MLTWRVLASHGMQAYQDLLGCMQVNLICECDLSSFQWEGLLQNQHHTSKGNEVVRVYKRISEGYLLDIWILYFIIELQVEHLSLTDTLISLCLFFLIYLLLPAASDKGTLYIVPWGKMAVPDSMNLYLCLKKSVMWKDWCHHLCSGDCFVLELKRFAIKLVRFKRIAVMFAL